MPQQPTILGIDPGTRFMGVAVVRGPQLVEYGVHRLRNGDRADNLLLHAREVLFRIIRDHAPQIVAIEAPYRIATKRGAVLQVLAAVLHQRSADLGIAVVEALPEAVRERVAGDPKARKIQVANALVRRFPQLTPYVPKSPALPVLWLTQRERYWLHMFDALAVAMAAQSDAHQIDQLSTA